MLKYPPGPNLGAVSAKFHRGLIEVCIEIGQCDVLLCCCVITQCKPHSHPKSSDKAEIRLRNSRCVFTAIVCCEFWRFPDLIWRDLAGTQFVTRNRKKIEPTRYVETTSSSESHQFFFVVRLRNRAKKLSNWIWTSRQNSQHAI